MKLGRRCGAGLAVLGLAVFGLTGCPEQPPPPKHAAGKHRQQPMPNPDPVRPAPGQSTFPGSVRITFWLEQASHKTITTYNVGHGPVTHNCNDSCHWDVDGLKPGQGVSFVTVFFTPGTKGHLSMQVVQQNNGRIVCQDNNDDAGGAGGIDASGVIVI